MRSLRLALIVLLFAGLAAAQKHVSFPAPDGYRLRADLYGKGPRGIVLAHGGRFAMESWDEQARIFAKAGFRVLALDFRGYGQTIAGTQTSDDKTYPDVLAAVRYLHSTGAKSVSVVGASMGAVGRRGAVVYRSLFQLLRQDVGRARDGTRMIDPNAVEHINVKIFLKEPQALNLADVVPGISSMGSGRASCRKCWWMSPITATLRLVRACC